MSDNVESSVARHFRVLAEQARAKNEERGYSQKDMRDMAENAGRRKRDWIRLFDEYITNLLYHAEGLSVTQIATKAAEMADARMQIVDERYPEGEYRDE